MLGVGLVNSSFTVNETNGYLTVGVEILDGILESEQSVFILTQAGTATPGTLVVVLLWLERIVASKYGLIYAWRPLYQGIIPVYVVVDDNYTFKTSISYLDMQAVTMKMF